MQYSNLGATGLVVSKIAFGTLTFGSGRGRAAGNALYKVDQAGAAELVSRALDAGVNHFNSADIYSYGESEELLGRALGVKRRDVVLSTKVGHRMSAAPTCAGLSKAHIIQACDDSLRRLETDYIDVYLAHLTDPFTPLEETLEAFEHLTKQGKIRYSGFSNWPAWLAATAVGLQKMNGFGAFRAAEMYYSLIGRDLEIEMLPFAKMAGIGIFVWSPLVNGFLSGKYTRQDPTGGGGRITGFDQIPFDRDRGYDTIDLLHQIAGKYDASPAAVSIAWLVAQPQVSSILVGASNQRQLDQNLKAADIVLDEADIAELSAVCPPYRPSPHWLMEAAGDDVREELLASFPNDFGVPPARQVRRWANWGRNMS